MNDFDFFNERLFFNKENGLLFWKNTEAIGWKVRGKQAGTITKKGYLVICVKKEGKLMSFKAHRLAWLLMKGSFPMYDIDHINGIKTDNRIENLREAPLMLNNQNIIKPKKANKLGALGVFLDKDKNYVASISIDAKAKVIGRFKCLKDAQDAYLDEKRKNHLFCTI